jgi:putative phosphoesterase
MYVAARYGPLPATCHNGMVTVAGVISDTHGLLRPEAVSALQGVDVILHAGDVGKAEVLDSLERIAPVHAIAGNIDPVGWLPPKRTVVIEEIRIYMVHSIADLDVPETDYQAIVYGHSHRPSIETRRGVLYVNPGSAGRRRFRLPVTVALLRITGGSVSAELTALL